MSGQFGTNWLDLSSTSNRYIQTYYKGFVDISGGPLYVRNNNLFVQGGDISLNGRLFSAGDISLNSRLYVASDVSFGNRLYVANDVSMAGNIYSMNIQSITTPSALLWQTVTPANATYASYTFSGGFGYLLGMSSTGQYMVTSAGTTGIWYSSNYGQTWTQSNQTTGAAQFPSMSSTGQYAICPSYWGNSFGIKYSSNYGQTWTASNASTGGGWDDSVMSSTGKYCIVANEGIGIWYSSNYGQTWTQSNLTTGCLLCQISSTGQYGIACINGPSVYYSSDYGQTWTQSVSYTTSTFGKPSMSASGQYATSATTNGLFYSTNYGQTWTQSNISSNLYVNFFGLSNSSSSSGQYVISGGSPVYYSSNYGLTWTLGTGFNANHPKLSSTGQFLAGTSGTTIYTTTFPTTTVQSPGQTTVAGLLNTLVDSSLNGRLYLGSDALFGAHLSVVGDLSLGGNVNGLPLGLGKSSSNSTNIAIGTNALLGATSAFQLIAIGSGAMQSNNGSGGVAIGYQTLYSNSNAGNQCAVGNGVLYSQTSGNNNSGFGHAVLYSNTNGSGNTGVGNWAMQATTTGSFNTAVGAGNTLRYGTYSNNTGIGYGVLTSGPGNNNSALGYSSLSLTTGTNNTALGYNTGTTNTTGSNNTYIGSGSNATAAAFSNSTALGYNASITGSNQIVIGTAAETTFHVGDSSFNQRLFVGGDVSINSNFYVGKNVGIAKAPTYPLDISGISRTSGGVILGTLPTTKYYNFAGTPSTATITTPSLTFTFGNSSFYARFHCFLSDASTNTVSTVVFDVQGGNAAGTAPSNNIAEITRVSTINGYYQWLVPTYTTTTVVLGTTANTGVVANYSVRVELIQTNAVAANVPTLNSITMVNNNAGGTVVTSFAY